MATGTDRAIRVLGGDFDPAVVAAIDAQLQAIAEREPVDVLLAVESGSRAWGFPSPDSDYDCRFIYVRRRDDYLALFPPRDVIECPVDAVLDLNGWDLAKALRLLLKGNAVVIEWLTSPFAYAGSARFRAEATELARQAAVPAAIARHYLHLGERQRRTYFADARAVPLKKMFYALRPAVALRWLRLHPGEAVAPMHFHDPGRVERLAGGGDGHRRRSSCAQGGDARARQRPAAGADRGIDRCRIRDRARAMAARAMARRSRDGGGCQRPVPALGGTVDQMRRTR